MTKNLKIYTASFMALLTMLTASGCSAKIEKEPINETPIIEQVEEPVVEVDPNAPLFDITDETVFNQKADELYAEIEGISYVDSGIVILEINNKDQAETILKLLNYESLTDEQRSIMNESNGFNYAIMLEAIATEKYQNNTNIEISKYVSNPLLQADMKRIEDMAKNYLSKEKNINDELKNSIIEELNYIESNNENIVETLYKLIVIKMMNKDYINSKNISRDESPLTEILDSTFPKSKYEEMIYSIDEYTKSKVK